MRRKKNMTELEFIEWIIQQKITDDNNCWIWKNGKNSAGYGCTSFEGKMVLVHRFFFEKHFNNPLNDDEDVRHICPNTPNILCFNPDHLTKGSRKENMQDMVLYGRSQKGEKNYHSKLTDENVLFIRAQRDSFSLKELSEMYGVDQALISIIINNKIWKHV